MIENRVVTDPLAKYVAGSCVVLSIIVLFFLVVAQGSVNYSPPSISFSYEPNAVGGKLLGAVQGSINVPMLIPLSCNDAEGDPFVIVAENPPAGFFVIKESDVWRIQWTPIVAGLYYVTLVASDIPPAGVESESKEHTILFNVLPVNTAPEIEELEDTVVSYIWPNDYQKRFQELKKSGTIILGIVAKEDLPMQGE